jgi:predicted Zn-dependent peptidase
VKAIRAIRAEELMQLAQKYLQKNDIYEVVAGNRCYGNN